MAIAMISLINFQSSYEHLVHCTSSKLDSCARLMVFWSPIMVVTIEPRMVNKFELIIQPLSNTCLFRHVSCLSGVWLGLWSCSKLDMMHQSLSI